MALDWISRVFSSGPAKGLSGEGDGQTLDLEATWYSQRLRRHRIDGDLIEDPRRLWSGLEAHLTARRALGSADYTDILLVLNEHDFRRGLQKVLEPWTDQAARALAAELDRYVQETGFQQPHPSRGARFRILQDGGPEMEGEHYELGPGEFVTGLISNMYAGPSAQSRPLIAVHLNLPDVWDGYKEVGRLYTDQVALTLGNHWLDNVSHFGLQEAALYRLQQYLDGSFVHLIDPDLADRYTVQSDESADGPNILTIVDSNGEAVAHLVLALLDAMVADERGESIPPAHGIQLPPPTGLRDSLATSLGVGQRTIVPESVQERIFTLRETGALLQKVHFRKFMEGYDVYVSPNGSLSTNNPNPAATFQVRGDQVRLVVHSPSVRVDGEGVPLEVPRPLGRQVRVQVGPHTLEYRDLAHGRSQPGWPYLGEIVRPPTSTHMVFGTRYRIGRDRRCKVQLPDEAHNDNIAWHPDAQQGSSIRARSGEIPKSRFYTDSIMVASEHAELDLVGEPRVRSVARHCYTYLRRAGEITALHPAKGEGDRELELSSGDELLVGNCLFQVSYSPDPGDSPQPAPLHVPPPRLTADALADALDTDGEEERRRKHSPERSARLIDAILKTPPPEPGASRERSKVDSLLSQGTPPTSSGLDAILEVRQPAGTDLPVAAGLGEAGPPPVPHEVQVVAYDSLIGDPLHSVHPFDDEPSILPTIEEEDAGVLPEDSVGLDEESGVPFGLPGPDHRPPPDPSPFEVFGGPVVDHGGPLPPATIPPGPGAIEEQATRPMARPSSGASLQMAGGGPRRVVGPESIPEPMSLGELKAQNTYEPELPGAFPPEAFPPEPAEPFLKSPSPDTLPPESIPEPPPAAPEPSSGLDVTIIEDERISVELARPARLLQVGWALSGEVLVGNHDGCAVVVPELRYAPDQAFQAREYFRVKLRGRGRAERLDNAESRLRADGALVDKVKDLDHASLEIVRRDDDGDEDFTVLLAVDGDFKLPDPRSRVLAIDLSDPLVEGLFVQGLPLGATHRVSVGPISASARFDGTLLELSDYLESYKAGGRYKPFFVRHGQAPFRTVPEDGRPLRLEAGDVLVAAGAVLRFEIR